MQIRTYRARSLKEALQMVQHDLGPDATVVQTRELQTGWWERFAKGRHFEIRTRPPGPAPLPLRRFQAEPGPSSSAGRERTITDPPLNRLRRASSLAERSSSTGELSFERNPSAGPQPSEPIPANWFELMAELIEAELPEAAARELLDALRQRGLVTSSLNELRAALREILAEQIRCAGPLPIPAGQPAVVALVGPTGVGKTTTIAKLAADLRLRQQRRVGLITIDTFRIAAVDQLRTYAEIMELPLEVVGTPREMREALARLADQEVILIDTAGRGPRDAVQLQQMRALLHEAAPQEIHLVASGVATASHLRQTIAQFSQVGATHLLLTKLDEATGLGYWVPLLREAGLPLRYLTCGQNVPEDLLVADADRLLPVLAGQQPLESLWRG